MLVALLRASFCIIVDFRQILWFLENLSSFIYLAAIIMKSKTLLCIALLAHTLLSAIPVSAGIEPRWKVAGTGKFGSEASPDILLYRPETGDVVIWDMTQPQTSVIGTSAGDPALYGTSNWSVKTQRIMPNVGANSGWKVGAVADFNGDGISDIFWHQPSTGSTIIWPINPNSTSVPYYFSLNAGANSGWEVIGSGNFDGDGKRDDILWYNQNTGGVIVWLIENGAVSSWKQIGSSSYRPTAVFDRNSDGISDIFFQSGFTSSFFWLINSNSGIQYTSPVRDHTSPFPNGFYGGATCNSCKAVGAGDFMDSKFPDSFGYAKPPKADGIQDIVMQDQVNGNVHILAYGGNGPSSLDANNGYIGGANVPSKLFNSYNVPVIPPYQYINNPAYASNYQIVAIADFDQYNAVGSGGSFKTNDVLYQEKSSGRLFLSTIDTGSVSQLGGLYVVGAGLTLPESKYQALP